MIRNFFNYVILLIRYIRQYGFSVTYKKLKDKLRKNNVYKIIFKKNLFKGQHFDFIFVIGCWGGTAKRYRVYDRVRYLESLGYSTLILKVEDLSLLIKGDVKTSVVIIFRATLNSIISGFIKFARRKDIFTAWDVDDLIFEPKYFHLMKGAQNLSSLDQKKHLIDLNNYQKLLKCVNLGIFTTNALKNEAGKFNINSEIIENGFDEISRIASNKILNKKSKYKKDKDKLIYIGYFSGTNTHQVDFLECEAALIKILKSHKNTRFILGGYLDLSNKWKNLNSKVIRIPFVNYHLQLDYLSKVDINLAPLEKNNLFCEAKSNLKFFEAALVETTTIASPTEPFKASIVDGCNGYIAKNSQQWFERISFLVRNKKQRIKVGKNARDYVIKKYSQDVLGKKFIELLKYNVEEKKFPKPSSIKIPKSYLRVAFIIPGIILNSGGHRNIFRIANYLSKDKFKITFYVKNEDDRSIIEMKNMIKNNFYNFQFDIFHISSVPSNQDIIFATHHSTVEDCLNYKNNFSEIYYFVQDLEYLFYPVSSDYIKAQNTYKYNFKTITSGPLPAKILKQRFGTRFIDYFQLPIDTKTYKINAKISREKKIIFFAKPEMPRRCYELGIEALKIIKDKIPNYEIILFGSNDVPNADRKIFKNLGILPTIEDLSQLYQSSTLGIVFSTTNPSLVPFEMMACGLPVADLMNDYSKFIYNNSDDYAYLLDSRPEIMAQQIFNLLQDRDLLKLRSKRSSQFVNSFPNELEASRKVINFIKSSFYKLKDEL